ncbi:MAG: class SAM-dependent methyltransferase [Sphingomonas bacterium]|nr:class SAM-dependent methyltransferase [Sphingomonas bacterium]
MSATELPPAAFAFDSVAETFDDRFGPWLSVAAQRRPVRAALATAFAPGATVIEIGGGTGEDAHWLLERGRQVVLTDASPEMVRIAGAKLHGMPGASVALAAAEALETFANDRDRAGAAPFDGAFSNFAGLNCVSDLTPVARGLARLVRAEAPVLLVVFGTFCVGEMVVEGVRGRPRNMFRRFARGDVPARLSGRHFTVRYHRQADIIRAMSPWFESIGRQGIGVFVPPSAAEPWISKHPHLLRGLEWLDRSLSRPLAGLGDHVLYRFVRNRVPVEAAR